MLVFFTFPIKEQQKPLSKQEKGPLKVTFIDDDDVEEMIDLSSLYKYLNSQSLVVCYFLKLFSVLKSFDCILEKM